MSAYDRPLGEVKLLTVAEVAAMLRLSKMTVYRMVNSGTLPALKVGRSVRIPEHVVDEYLRRSFVDSA
ncbi:MAG: helix-turn-helix domain-containing protein [Candidatus Nanopelagicales bacterium]|jgi:excisionase family DNA binding protein|nr:helix-turn-helix domain-containing protein [Candidatus Nanopelagicales bacterium]